QERAAAQCARRGGAGRRRAVEGAEAQRVEDLAVEVAPGGEALVEAVDQVAPVAVQPALRLDEVEEQHTGEGGERERMPLAPAAGRRQAVCQPLQRGPEHPEEPRGDPFARERFADPQAERERRFPRVETERPKEVAKIVDLLGAGEKFPQHHGTPGSETTNLGRGAAGLGTGVLRGGANSCGKRETGNGKRRADHVYASRVPVPVSRVLTCSFSALSIRSPSREQAVAPRSRSSRAGAGAQAAL